MFCDDALNDLQFLTRLDKTSSSRHSSMVSTEAYYPRGPGFKGENLLIYDERGNLIFSNFHTICRYPSIRPQSKGNRSCYTSAYN